MRATTVEVRIVGAEADRNLAFEAAEAALRDAERDIVTNDLRSSSPFANDCTDGLCRISLTATPVWQSVNWADDAFTRTYGEESGAGAYPVQSGQAPPRYVIELLPDLPPAPGNSLNLNNRASTGGGTAFRITAVGWGRDPSTRQTLQSVFVKQ
jgi:type IV pilus assembly protein PilX